MISRSLLSLIGKDSLKYKQTPPFLVLRPLSDLKGSGEKPLIQISSFKILVVSMDSQTPNMSTSFIFCRLSIRGILAKSLAERLSKFHIAKESFFCGLTGPGLSSIVPEIKSSTCNTDTKKSKFFNFSGKVKRLKIVTWWNIS